MHNMDEIEARKSGRKRWRCWGQLRAYRSVGGDGLVHYDGQLEFSLKAVVQYTSFFGASSTFCMVE